MFDMIAALTWTPGVRGVLVVAVGVIVLMGSVYLLLATNSGNRLGFLLALTGLFGWLTIMGLIWSIYGIGRLGPQASWVVLETNYGNLTEAGVTQARQLPEPSELPATQEELESDPALAKQFPTGPTVKAPTLGDLVSVKPSLGEQIDKQLPEGWTLLASSDSQTGEANASASNYLLNDRKLFTSSSDFVIVNAFSFGGKERRPADAGTLERIGFKAKRIATWPLGHPAHYAVVQVQAAVPQTAKPGEPPPIPKADPSAPVISVIMERDLGARRLPSITLMIFSAIIFAICISSLHRRDKLVTQARAAAAKG